MEQTLRHGAPLKTVKDYEEITFKVHEGVARIAFNRPEVRNAFTPKTVDELWEVLITCHESQDIVVLITGEGPSPKDGGWAFCSGGDQNVRSDTATKAKTDQPLQHFGRAAADPFHEQGCHRCGAWMGRGQALARRVRHDWPAGARHFQATNRRGLCGLAPYLARQVGQKRAREIFFLGASYSAKKRMRWAW